jgi:hypothetical protein
MCKEAGIMTVHGLAQDEAKNLTLMCKVATVFWVHLFGGPSSLRHVRPEAWLLDSITDN